MQLEKIIDNDIFLFRKEVHIDERGSLSETYLFDFINNNLGFNFKVLQENFVKSKKNVIRGLHFQSSPHSQGKLVSVLHGEIFDVIVDIRRESKNYLNTYKFKLSEANQRILFIPKGFAHGYLTISESSTVIYKVDSYYNKKFELGLNCFDKNLNIKWPVKKEELIINERDKNYPELNKILF